jgi:hypothetical protein
MRVSPLTAPHSRRAFRPLPPRHAAVSEPADTAPPQPTDAPNTGSPGDAGTKPEPAGTTSASDPTANTPRSTTRARRASRWLRYGPQVASGLSRTVSAQPISCIPSVVIGLTFRILLIVVGRGVAVAGVDGCPGCLGQTSGAEPLGLSLGVILDGYLRTAAGAGITRVREGGRGWEKPEKPRNPRFGP